MGFLSKGFGALAGGTFGLGFSSFNSILKQINGSSQQKDANAMAMQAWNIANDYNHPVNQMARLKAAGLNPNLVYGSGSVTGNTASAPGLVGGGISTGVESAFKGLNQVLGFAQGKATLDSTKAQAQASQAAAGASSAQAANLNAQAAINETRNKYEEKSQIADLNYKQALAEKTKAEASIAKGEANIFGDTGGSKGANTLLDVGKGIVKTVRGIFKR